MMNENVLGRNLRHYRILRGLTQNQFSDLLGWQHGPISFYETGKSGFTNPNLRLINRMAGVLGVTAADLLRVDPPTPSVLSTSQVAQRLGVSPQKARKFILASGKAIYIGRHLYILETDLFGDEEEEAA